MNVKLNELKDTSVRLLGVTKAMGIETLSELKEWYINQSLDTPLPKNMGRKTLMEIEDLISANKNGMGRFEYLEHLAKERKVTKLKNLVKQLHKEMFYKDDYDLVKMFKISSSLTTHLKNI